jgi:hypothetical protein
MTRRHAAIRLANIGLVAAGALLEGRAASAQEKKRMEEEEVAPPEDLMREHGLVPRFEKAGRLTDLTKEHALFGEDGFDRIVDRVASIEKTLDIYDLARFTPRV